MVVLFLLPQTERDVTVMKPLLKWEDRTKQAHIQAKATCKADEKKIEADSDTDI